jgi:hypothetical protein
MANNVEIGSYTGTGAAINIELGFIPDYVLIENATDGDANWKWFGGMADASALQQVAAGTKTLITSNGVTPLAGDRTTPRRPGFTIGTALSESAKVFRFVAMRSSHD